jgi:hypothetical protein
MGFLTLLGCSAFLTLHGCSGARSVWNHEWCDVGPEPRVRAQVVRAGVELSEDKLKKQPLCPGGCPAPEPDGRVRVKGRVRRQLRDPAAKTKYEATVSLWTGSDELVCFLTRFDVGLGGPVELPGRHKTKDEL